MFVLLVHTEAELPLVPHVSESIWFHKIPWYTISKMFFKKLSNRDSPEEGNLHLTYFNVLLNSSPTLKIILRSIFYSSSFQELPNQLVLQTGHRNAAAKTAPWTLHATQRLQSDLLLRPVNFTEHCTNLAWYFFPDKPHSKLVYLNNPLTKIY